MTTINIPKPKNCNECRLNCYNNDGYDYCKATGSSIENAQAILSDCPLDSTNMTLDNMFKTKIDALIEKDFSTTWYTEDFLEAYKRANHINEMTDEQLFRFYTIINHPGFLKHFRETVIGQINDMMLDIFDIEEPDDTSSEKTMLTDEEIETFQAYIENAEIDIAFGNSDWNQIYNKIVNGKWSDYADAKREHYRNIDSE